MLTSKAVKTRVMILRTLRFSGLKLYSLSNFIVRTIKADGFMSSAFCMHFTLCWQNACNKRAIYV